ncbi:MAG: inositol monophosphatase family protein [Myxococcota bacterium]
MTGLVRLDSTAAQARRVAAEVIAREAAAILMAHRQGNTVTWKGVGDLVTAADRASEAHVVARLAGLFPDDVIVAEEGGGSAGGLGTARNDWVWYVDPLDGTTNFVCGLPHFSVSLGAFHGGQAAVGVIAAPELGKLWSGARGLGAYVEGGGGREPLRVSTVATLERALAATGFPYDRSRRAADLVGPLRRALERCLDVRRLGSASLDLALVADGSFGVYWEPRLKAWDLAAGVLLVREAGGTATDHAGLDGFLASGDIVATNGLLHAAFMRDVLAASDA